MPAFLDRLDAAQQLAAHPSPLRHGPAGVVLAVPRGGVPIGAVLARALGWPLDLALTKKIGHPDNPELAVGAVSAGGYVLEPGLYLPDDYLAAEVGRIRAELLARRQAYLGEREPLPLTGKTVLLTDDGVATGHTLRATLELLREQRPARLLVAVPVAAPAALVSLQPLADEVLCLLAPPDFRAVGQYYAYFRQTTDEEVRQALREAGAAATGATEA
ncbi:phosphoribosyltransferase [Hymenobacter gummosus]|uniref:Phosphoribosyltransferase n=1 Tax=Hymenobacter gummosus TaxID=1776032 RepID=A0A3S0QJ15_9BACT|nr:phosphoribosyltransferase family protein [Hymenobacter gummosus]RTQ50869.1 phosphoribosyltransferase [Hymenobacter gummosus]